MPVARVTSDENNGASLGSIQIVNMTNVGGNFLIAKVGWQGGAISLSGVADTANGAWTVLTTTSVSEPSCRACLAYRENIAAASASNTITATFSGTSDFVNIEVTEYSGIRTSGSFDDEAQGTGGGGGGTTFSTANMDVTDGGLLFYGTEIFSTGDVTPGTSNGQSWVEVQNESTHSTAEMLNKSPGTYAGAATFGSAVNWAMTAAAFKAPAAPAGDLGVHIGEPISGYGVLN